MASIAHALPVVQQVIIAYLAAVPGLPTFENEPAAYWQLAKAGAARALESGALARLFVAQAQDGGGRIERRVGDALWSGLVTIRALSRSNAAANALLLALPLTADPVPALAGLVAPDGYAIHAVFDRPVAVPPLNGIVTSASAWRVTLNAS